MRNLPQVKETSSMDIVLEELEALEDEIRKGNESACTEFRAIYSRVTRMQLDHRCLKWLQQ